MKHLIEWFRDARFARSSTTGGQSARSSTNDGRGRLLSRTSSSAAVVPVQVAAGGVTLVRR